MTWNRFVVALAAVIFAAMLARRLVDWATVENVLSMWGWFG